MKKTVRYRLDVNYLSKDRNDLALETSSPIYTKKDGIRKYKEALREACVDDRSKAARVHLWKYFWDGNGVCIPVTILKNY